MRDWGIEESIDNIRGIMAQQGNDLFANWASHEFRQRGRIFFFG